MNKIRLLSFLALALFLTNIGLLVFIYNGSNNNPKEKGPRNIIIKKLSFSAEQIAQYDKLIEQHRKEIRTTEESIRKTKQQLYITLKSDTAAAANVSVHPENNDSHRKVESKKFSVFSSAKTKFHFIFVLMFAGIIAMMISTGVTLQSEGSSWAAKAVSQFTDSEMTDLAAISYSRAAFSQVRTYLLYVT
jgi:Spy/CpxP family protein refolding chaperone